jgi:predicted RNase H-like nuclease
MKMKISKSNLQEFVREIKRLKLRHKPFIAHARAGYYEIELYPDPNELFLLMKYVNDITG